MTSFIFRSKVGNWVGEKVGEKLSSNQEKILKLIEKNAWVTAQSISEAIGISKRKTEENISKLKLMEKNKKSRLCQKWALGDC